MESGKKTRPGSAASSSSYASTGSSITNELFGPKTPKPNTGIFDSVFSPPTTYARSEVVGSWRKKESENQGWNSKQKSSSGNGPQSSEGRSSIFQDHRVEPHSLSSSIYYGGQEVYSTPSDSPSSPSAYTYKKEGEGDDDSDGHNSLHSASRGNWWQGGLYY